MKIYRALFILLYLFLEYHSWGGNDGPSGSNTLDSQMSPQQDEFFMASIIFGELSIPAEVELVLGPLDPTRGAIIALKMERIFDFLANSTISDIHMKDIGSFSLRV